MIAPPSEFETRIMVGRARRPVPLGFVGVMIGRPTALCNPFHLSEYDRNTSLSLYQRYFEDALASGGAVLAAVERLVERLLAGERLLLMCWCSPQPCHGDLIRLEVIRRAKQRVKASQV